MLYISWSSPFLTTGHVLRSHSTRSTQSSCPVSASVSSIPEMSIPKASFLTPEGTRITLACKRLSPAHPLREGSKSLMLGHFSDGPYDL